VTTASAGPSAGDSVFDRVPGVYAFVREHLFRDDTERILVTLWPGGRAPTGATVVELGCGPGFYARRLATRLGHVRISGLDRSPAQVAEARERAERAGLGNCHFELGDVTRMPYPDQSVDALIASRLLVVLEQPEQAIGEMHRVLRPGGRAFIAEPVSALRTELALGLLRAADELRRRRAGERAAASSDRVSVLDWPGFVGLLDSQPWRRMHTWSEAGYRYAVVQKADA
jgi:ubiquinone/menaquinone biosynthesis C-methylase UbiE